MTELSDGDGIFGLTASPGIAAAPAAEGTGGELILSALPDERKSN